MPHDGDDDIGFRDAERPNSKWSNRMTGLILLLIVNVLWVLSSEVLRFIFVEEDFKRPFFVAYVKNSMLSVYLIRYMLSKEPQIEKSYKILDMEEFTDIDSLSVEGFETMSESESVHEQTDAERERRVRFSSHREVRRMPSSEAVDAQQARRGYNPAVDCANNCTLTIPRHVKWTLFFFAPMWLVCSFTYQTALAFTSVSALNLISSSSSLFVLVFAICIPVQGQRFTLMKALLVTINLVGVGLVTQFSMDFVGAVFAQVSAVAYALYLTAYARYQEKFAKLNINFMFGCMGIVTVVVGSPLLFVMDVTGVEHIHPFPTREQLGSILLAGFFGTLLADYLWLLGAGMTDSLSASLSMTLSIPFSFLADTVLRGRPPTIIQLIAAIPITLSFIGAALIEGNASSTGRMQRALGVARRREERTDREGLLESVDAEL